MMQMFPYGFRTFLRDTHLFVVWFFSTASLPARGTLKEILKRMLALLCTFLIHDILRILYGERRDPPYLFQIPIPIDILYNFDKGWFSIADVVKRVLGA